MNNRKKTKIVRNAKNISQKEIFVVLAISNKRMKDNLHLLITQ
jgi:hypothetical protein